MLVTTWFEDPHRPTRDLDLLGYGDSSAEAMSSVWKEIFEIAMDDGITFDSDPLRIDPIREEIEYGGLHTEAEIAQLLNRKGLTSGTGKRFHRLILRRIRSVYGLKSRYKRLRSRGLLTNVRWQNGYTSATPPSNYGGARVFSRRTAMTTKTSICLNVPPRWRQ